MLSTVNYDKDPEDSVKQRKWNGGRYEFIYRWCIGRRDEGCSVKSCGAPATVWTGYEKSEPLEGRSAALGLRLEMVKKGVNV